MVNNFTLGFAFNKNNKYVLFKRYYNNDTLSLSGISSQASFGENFRENLTKEFNKETGVTVDKDSWHYVCNAKYPDKDIHVFAVSTDVLTDIDLIQQVSLMCCDVEVIKKLDLQDNVSTLIELCLLRLNQKNQKQLPSISF